MSTEDDNHDLKKTDRDEPGLVRFSEAITETEDPEQAAKFADLFLLCMASAGTVLGSLIGCGLFANFRQSTSSNGGLDSVFACFSGFGWSVWLRKGDGYPALERPDSMGNTKK